MTEEKNNRIKSLDEKLGPDWEGKIVLEEQKTNDSYPQSYVWLRRCEGKGYYNLVAEFKLYDEDYRVSWRTYTGQKQLRNLTEKLYPAKRTNAIIDFSPQRFGYEDDLRKMPLKDVLRSEDKIHFLGVDGKHHGLWWKKGEYGYEIEFNSCKKSRETLEALLKSTMPKRDWEQIIKYLDKILKKYPD